jgi:hypothetical protein
MFDDRGLDLIAADRSELQSIYDRHRDWLLNYDRKRIAAIFQ